MPERNGLRLSAAAAMVLLALCTRGMCDSPCCIDDLYCVVTDPSVCQTLGGVSANEIETCTDWAECGSNNEIFPTETTGGWFGQDMDLEFTAGHVAHLAVGSPQANGSRGGASIMEWMMIDGLESWVPVFEMDTSDFNPGDMAGASVATDANWTVVGIPGREQVFVFSYEDGSWIFRQLLMGGPDDEGFGSSLALSGSTLFIGAPDSASDGGGVTVFTSQGGSESNPWVFQNRITADNPGGLGFGYAIAMDSAMGRAAVGAPFGNGGRLYELMKNGTNWEIKTDLTEDLPAGYGKVGTAIDMVGDVLYASAPEMIISGTTLGVVWVFEWGSYEENVDSFYLSGFIAPPDGMTGTEFGASLSLQPGMLLVGSPNEDGSGAVHVYTPQYIDNAMTTLVWDTRFTGGASGDRFGASLAAGWSPEVIGGLALAGSPGATLTGISGAGRIDVLQIGDVSVGSGDQAPPVEFARMASVAPNTAPEIIQHAEDWAMCGWPNHDSGSGGIQLFKHDGTDWIPVGDMIQGDTNGFGQDIAMLNGTAAVGSPQGSGTIHLYSYSDDGLSHVTTLQPTSRPNAAAGSSLALAANSDGDMMLAIGAPGMDVELDAKPITNGSIYIYGRMAGTATWFLDFGDSNGNGSSWNPEGLGFDVEAAWLNETFNVAVGQPYTSYGGEVCIFEGTLKTETWTFVNGWGIQPEVGQLFGASLAYDNNILAVGGPGASKIYPAGSVHLLEPIFGSPEDVQFNSLDPRAFLDPEWGFGKEVGMTTIDGIPYVAVGLPKYKSTSEQLGYTDGGAVDLYAKKTQGGGEGSPYALWEQQTRVLARNTHPADTLGGSLSFGNGRLLFSNGLRSTPPADQTSSLFASHDTQKKCYWLSAQGGQADNEWNWSLEPQAGDTVVFSLIESTVYFTELTSLEQASVEVMFDRPILSTGYGGSDDPVPMTLTSLSIASDADIRTAGVLIDGLYTFTDFVQVGGQLSNESGDLHIFGFSRVLTNNYTQKAGGQVRISVTESGWNPGDSSFISAETMDIQGSLTMNVEDSQINQLKVGDRINLLQSTATPSEHDRFDLVVFPGLPNDLAFAIGYDDADRGPSPWTVYAEVVSLSGLLDFGDPNSVPVAGNPVAVDATDLTGDGADEICILFDGMPGSLVIFENDGAGGVSQQIIVQTCDTPTGITSGDFDADGNTDLAISCGGDIDSATDGSITVLYNENLDLLDGFENSYTHDITGSPTCLAAITWDDVTPEDLAVGIRLSSDGTDGMWQILIASTLRNGEMTDGPASNSNGIPIDIGGKPEDEEAPKDADIRFVGTTGLGNVAVGKRNLRRGGASMNIDEYLVGSDLSGIVYGDLDNDGQKDITTISRSNGQLAVLFADPSGSTFLNPIYVHAGTAPSGLTGIDFDQDGNLDLATITNNNDGQRIVRVLQNDGNLLFTIVETASGEQPLLIETGDVSGNGIAELITIDGSTLRSAGDGGMLTLRNIDGVTACQGDVNGDAVVDVLDLLDVIGNWGTCSACQEDIDGNGSVDVLDLLAVIAAWGDCIS